MIKFMLHVDRFLKLYIKGNKLKDFFVVVYVLFHKTIERICRLYIKSFFPIDESIVLFRSMPDYSDNARALSDYMVNNGYTKKYRIFFDVDRIDNFKNQIEGVTFFSCKTKFGCYKFSSLRLILTAKYLLSTHELICKRNFARRGQCIIRLWHGCGYKTRITSDNKVVNKFDAALVPGPLFVKIKADFWGVEEKCILPIGYPRYDWLKSKDYDAQKIINSFRNNENTKIVMWMPTFRIDKNRRFTYDNIITQFPIVDSIKRWKELDQFCELNNIVLLVKLHPYQADYPIPFDSFTCIKEIKNATFEEKNIPMYKFIALTDALITDYSSIAIDYLLVNRPIAYTLDFFEEDKKTRKFIIDDPREYMPGYHLYHFEDLKAFISDLSLGSDPYKSQREQFAKIAITPSDNYCKSILSVLGISI